MARRGAGILTLAAVVLASCSDGGADETTPAATTTSPTASDDVPSPSEPDDGASATTTPPAATTTTITTTTTTPFEPAEDAMPIEAMLVPLPEVLDVGDAAVTVLPVGQPPLSTAVSGPAAAALADDLERSGVVCARASSAAIEGPSGRYNDAVDVYGCEFPDPAAAEGAARSILDVVVETAAADESYDISTSESDRIDGWRTVVETFEVDERGTFVGYHAIRTVGPRLFYFAGATTNTPDDAIEVARVVTAGQDEHLALIGVDENSPPYGRHELDRRATAGTRLPTWFQLFDGLDHENARLGRFAEFDHEASHASAVESAVLWSDDRPVRVAAIEFVSAGDARAYVDSRERGTPSPTTGRSIVTRGAVVYEVTSEVLDGDAGTVLADRLVDDVAVVLDRLVPDADPDDDASTRSPLARNDVPLGLFDVFPIDALGPARSVVGIEVSGLAGITDPHVSFAWFENVGFASVTVVASPDAAQAVEAMATESGVVERDGWTVGARSQNGRFVSVAARAVGDLTLVAFSTESFGDPEAAAQAAVPSGDVVDGVLERLAGVGYDETSFEIESRAVSLVTFVYDATGLTDLLGARAARLNRWIEFGAAEEDGDVRSAWTVEPTSDLGAGSGDPTTLVRAVEFVDEAAAGTRLEQLLGGAGVERVPGVDRGGVVSDDGGALFAMQTGRWVWTFEQSVTAGEPPVAPTSIAVEYGTYWAPRIIAANLG